MSIQSEHQRWRQEVLEPALARHQERNNGELNTSSGIPLKRLYLPPDGTAKETERYKATHGFPGEFPYTRGVQPTMYRGRYWTMRQYAGFGSAAETNERFRYLLEAGQTGLSVAFDLPTQLGYDSDHSLCLGEVGKVGVAVDSLEDMELLFHQIPLDSVSTSMTINAPAAILLAMYIVVAEKQGVAPEALRGTIQNDILKEYIARGTFMFPPKPSMRLITNTFAYCTTALPKWNTISISGYHIREAGATAPQEIAFTLADAIAYVDAAVSAGLPVDDFARRLSFFFSSGSDLLEEVAKFRAVRRMWAHIMRDRYGATTRESMALRFHAQTSGAMLTAQQPDNNVVRVTLHALAAVLGGAQSLHTNSRDEALSLPTEESVQIALRTQQILANESGVANTIDPLGGSWAVEELTNEIEAQAQAYLDTIATAGGMVAAIENGYPQREIEDAAYQYQREIEENKRLVVGLNCHTREANNACFDVMQPDPRIHDSQVTRLQRLRERRDNSAVARELDALRKAAETAEADLMAPIISCVRQYATLGEISQVLRDTFGEHRQHIGM